MSSAAPTADAATVVPEKKKGKKKLIIIVAAVLVLLLAGGGGAAFYLKKKAAAAAAAAEGGDEAPAADAHHADKPDLKHPPTFLPLDPFVVNLTDKEADRYAQIGITLEVADAHFADEVKAFMPAIRNGILMILSHKSSAELLDRPGKEKLAAEILREASRTMGIEVEEPEAEAEKPAAAEGAKDGAKDKADAEASDEDAKPAAKKKPKKAKKEAAEPNPIRRVHFSNFIVQ